MSKKMQIWINGQTQTVADDLTIAALLESMGHAMRWVAVEVNQTIVSKSSHASHKLKADDRVEIVQAMGGG
jgi:thiamine biosynthesis protein ThiS